MGKFCVFFMILAFIVWFALMTFIFLFWKGPDTKKGPDQRLESAVETLVRTIKENETKDKEE